MSTYLIHLCDVDAQNLVQELVWREIEFKVTYSGKFNPNSHIPIVNLNDPKDGNDVIIISADKDFPMATSHYSSGTP